MSDTNRGKWGRWALVNAAVAAWLIYTIATPSEAPSSGLALLQYVLLVCSLLGLAGALYQLAAAKS